MNAPLGNGPGTPGSGAGVAGDGDMVGRSARARVFVQP
jgi:hypothetical protein